MTRKFWLVSLASIALISGFLLILDFDFLQQSKELFWHVPYRSFVIMLGLLAITSFGKVLAGTSIVEQTFANIGLAIALSWFPLSLIFSGNVRNIFSASSLVSYDVWLLLSITPIVTSLIITAIWLTTRQSND